MHGHLAVLFPLSLLGARIQTAIYISIHVAVTRNPFSAGRKQPAEGNSDAFFAMRYICTACYNVPSPENVLQSISLQRGSVRAEATCLFYCIYLSKASLATISIHGNEVTDISFLPQMAYTSQHLNHQFA